MRFATRSRLVETRNADLPRPALQKVSPRHARSQIHGSAPTSPSAIAIVRLAGNGVSAGCAVANADLDGLREQ